MTLTHCRRHMLLQYVWDIFGQCITAHTPATICQSKTILASINYICCQKIMTILQLWEQLPLVERKIKKGQMDNQLQKIE